MIIANRILWSIIFLAGTALFAWQSWTNTPASPMVFFLLTGLWSAVCGIAYSVFHWFLDQQD